MSPSVSPDRPSNERRIQDQQTEIDKLDGDHDGKTEITGLSQEQRDALKAAYIDKVNAAQGSIRRSFEKIRTQKEQRTDKWREWEEKVLDIESDLARLLEKSLRTLKDPQAADAVNQAVATMNGSVDEYLQKLDALKQQYDAPAEESPMLERPEIRPQSVESIFAEWNVPGAKEDVDAKATLAVSRYGEENIRELSAVIALYDALPKALRQKYFKTDAQVNRAQIAGQLANGTFEQSPLGVLLEESSLTVDRKIAESREQNIDRVQVLTEQLQDLNERTRTQIVRLCGITREDIAKGTIADIVAWAQNTNGYPQIQAQIVRTVQELGTQVQAMKQEMALATAEIRVIDASLRSLDTAIAHQQGREDEESQLLFLQNIESGTNIPLSPQQVTRLRPSQQELLGGRNTDALRTSVRDFNQYADAHPELDALDRTDVLRLTNSSRQEKRDAEFARPAGLGSGTDFLLRSASAPERQLHVFLGDSTREVTTLSRTGKIGNGREFILVELQRPGSDRKEHALAVRDGEGIVRLQDGTVLQNPVELKPTTVDISHTDKRTLYVSPKVEKLLAEQIGKDPRRRLVLRSGLSTSPIQAPLAVGNFTVLDASQIQITEKGDDGTLKFYDADEHLETSLDAERLRKEGIEKGGDVLQNIDAHPMIRDVTQRAGGLQENMQNMQLMLQTAMSSEANPGNEFIDQLRNYARPMLQTMEDPTTKQNVLQAKSMLEQELKSIKLGKYVGEGVEREIKDRIDALDSYIKVLSDNRLLHGLQTAMELRPNTWEAWRSKEGLIMLGAIIAAVIAIGVLTIFTGGAFLLTVPGILASSAVGGLAGMVGEQGTRELLYQYHNREGGGVRSGEYRYTDGARIMNYSRGQKIFDEQTGKFVEMSFLSDVASPYAQEFLISFATTAAAMGVGSVAGKALSRLAQNSKMIHALSKNSVICNSIMKYLSGLTDDVAKSPTVRDFAKKTLIEILDELGDEAKEGAATQLLSRIDTRLGAMATFLVAATKGFRPLKGQRLSYGPDMTVESVRAWAEGQGHTVVSLKAGVFDIKTFDGQTLIFEPEAVALKANSTTSTNANDETVTNTDSDTLSGSTSNLDKPAAQTTDTPQSNTVNTNSLMDTRNRLLFYVVNLDGIETFVRATVTDIQQVEGRWTFAMEGALPDGSPFSSQFTESAEPGSDGFKIVEGVKIVNQDQARTFAVERQMQIASQSSPDLQRAGTTQITEQQAALRDKSQRIVGSLPPVPPGHTRIFRSIDGAYTPKQALTSAEQQELVSMQQLLSEGKTEGIDQQRFDELFNRNKPEMGGDDLLHVLQTYGDAANSTVLYADIDLGNRQDIDVEQRGVNGNFYVPPQGSVEWQVVPKEVVKGDAAPEHTETSLTAAKVKEIMKAGDISDPVRLNYAEQLLKRPVTPAEQDAILAAHRLPGMIDALTTEELAAKIAELRKVDSLSADERRVLIEAGICGAPPPPAWFRAKGRTEGQKQNPSDESTGSLLTPDASTNDGKDAGVPPPPAWFRPQGKAISDQPSSHIQDNAAGQESAAEQSPRLSEDVRGREVPAVLPTAQYVSDSQNMSVWRDALTAYDTVVNEGFADVQGRFPNDAAALQDIAPRIQFGNALQRWFSTAKISKECRDALRPIVEKAKIRDEIRNQQERTIERMLGKQNTITYGGRQYRFDRFYIQDSNGNPVGDIRFKALAGGADLLLTTAETYDLLTKNAQSEQETPPTSVKVKEIMKAGGISDSVRLNYAEQLLKRSLKPGEPEAILAAHRLPGTIDALTTEELEAKILELRKVDSLSTEDRRVLIEAGICGSASAVLDVSDTETLQIAPDSGNIIAARNAQNASPEAAQNAAESFIQNRIDEAKRVASGEASVEECITFAGGRSAVEKQMAGINEKLAKKGKAEYASLEAFVEIEVRKNAVRFTEVVARIDAGSIGGEGGNYIDKEYQIRALNKLVPGIDMEGKLALARRLHRAAMLKHAPWLEYARKNGLENANEQEYYRWLHSTEQTMTHTDADGRKVDGRPPLDTQLPGGEQVSLAENSSVEKRLESAITQFTDFAAEGSLKQFSQTEVQSILAEVQNPLDRAVLAETARLLETIESKAGSRSLTDADRWKILEFSARYLQDFRAAKFPASPEQLLSIVTDNAVDLAHQQIVDHQTLVGSSHGVLHVLRGNAAMLQSLYGPLGFTPEMRVLAMEADFHHDDGYGKRTLAGQNEEQGVFAASNDHPLESTLVVEAKRAEYEAIFGRDGYVTIRNAILDHSDPLGRGQYADNVTKLKLLMDPDANPAQRVAAALALVDCLATVSNLKSSPLIRDNPEIMAMIGRVGELSTQMQMMRKEGVQPAQILEIQNEAKNIRLGLQRRIERMAEDGIIEKSEADAYVLSLESTMHIESSDFAINRNLAMFGAGVSPNLRVEHGAVHASYTIDPRGQALIENVLGSERAKEQGVQALLFGANDFGGLSETDAKLLNVFVQNVRDIAKPAESDAGKNARDYLRGTPKLTLTTKGGLVMEFTVAQNLQYAEVANVVETNLRINAIRDLARINLDKIMKGEPLTVKNIEGKEIIVRDPEAYAATAGNAVESLVSNLPGYVVKNESGQYVDIAAEYGRIARATTEMAEAGKPGQDIARTWAAFCARIYESAGSASPIAPRQTTPSRTQPFRRAG